MSAAITPPVQWPEWWRTYRQRHAPDLDHSDPAARWWDVDQLTSGSPNPLQSAHAVLVQQGAPPKAAAKYLAGWWGGLAVGSVALALVRVGAVPIVQDDVRWLAAPDTWPIDLDWGAAPWLAVDAPSNAPGVTSVGQNDLRAVEAAVAALGVAISPIVEVCSTLARVSRRALWAEVADGVGTAIAGNPWLVANLGSERLLWASNAVLDAAAAPWARRPRLWAVGHDGERVVVSHKGGCCLAYTTAVAPSGQCETGEETNGAPAEVDDASRAPMDALSAYLARFPVESPGYCGNCLFRKADDVAQRVLFWSQLKSAEDAARRLCSPANCSSQDARDGQTNAVRELGPSWS